MCVGDSGFLFIYLWIGLTWGLSDAIIIDPFVHASVEVLVVYIVAPLIVIIVIIIFIIIITRLCALYDLCQPL